VQIKHFHFFPHVRVVHVGISKQPLQWRINHEQGKQATTKGNLTHSFRVVKVQGTIRVGRRLPGSTALPSRGLVGIPRVREAERSALESEIPL
jgi:hypothetical protein